MAAAKSGDIVELLKTSEGSGIQIDTSKKSLVFDLKGNTYTVTNPTVGSTGTETNAFQLLKGGSITFKNGTLKAGSSAKILIQNYCNLTLENVTVDCRDSSQCLYASSNNHGNIIMKGNTNIYAASGQKAFDVWYNLGGSYPDGVSVTIDKSMTGEINGIIEYGADSVTEEESSWTQKAKLIIEGGNFDGSFKESSTNFNGQTPNIVITGGTFSTDVNAYCPTGYSAVENNGKWVVGPAQGLEADSSASGTTSSATVGGSFDGSENDHQDNNVAVDGGTIQIDVTTGTNPDDSGSNPVPNESVTSTAVTITSDALDSISKTSNSVEITTDVATLTVDSAAWSTITDKAGDSAVTLSVEETATGKWTVTAQDASGSEVYDDADTNDGKIVISVTYENGNNVQVFCTDDGIMEPLKTSWDEATKVLSWWTPHLSSFEAVTLGAGVDATWVESGVTKTGTLAQALEALDNVGGTITVLHPATLTDAQYTISKPVTLTGPGPITATTKADGGVNNKAFTITDGGSLTLDGIPMTVNGTEAGADDGGAYNGIAFNMKPGSDLTVKNGAALTIQGLNRGIVADGGAAPIDADITVTGTGSKLIASSFGGNFSQGGQYVFSDGAEVSISNCVNHGLSANTIEVDNATLSVSDTGYCGIITSDTDAILKLEDGAKVTVTNCATSDKDTRPAVQMAGNLVVPEGTSLSVTGTSRNNILLAENSTNTLTGTIVGNIVNGSGDALVAAIDGGGSYTSLDAAVQAATTSGQTVRLLTTVEQTLTQAIGEGVTLVIDKDQAVNITALTAVVTSEGKIQVNANGALTVDSDKMIGADGNIKLTAGSIELSKTGSLQNNDLALQLDFKNATAEVPAGCRWTTVKNVGSYQVPMNVSLSAGTILTVNGSNGANTGFHVANGSTVTNSGTIQVNSSMSIGSSGKVEDAGTIVVGTTGVLVVDKSDSNNSVGTLKNSVTNNGTFVWNGTTADELSGVVTLAASGSKVYSQADISSKLKGSFTEMSNKTYQGTNYPYAWEYHVYVPPVVDPVDPSTPSTGGSEADGDYTVTVDRTTGGKVTVNPGRADKGDTVTITAIPNDGYVVDEVTVNGVTNGVKYLGDNKYSFEMPGSAAKVSVTFVKDGTQTGFPFTDVSDSFWARSEIEWAYENGYVNGSTATTFNPNGTISRQQVWMILARIAGQNPATMAEAKAWAIANGVSDGSNPGGSVTRQQLVTILYRFAGQNGYDTTARADLSSYPDVATVESYASDAMAWAVAEGIIGGTTQGTLNPAGTASRAQFAVILYRYMA